MAFPVPMCLWRARKPFVPRGQLVKLAVVIQWEGQDGEEQKSAALNLINNAEEIMKVAAVIAMIPVAVASVLIVALRYVGIGVRSVRKFRVRPFLIRMLIFNNETM